MMPSNQTELLTIGEAAALLALKPSRMRTAVFKRELPFLKIGKLLRFRREDLIQWVESKVIHPEGGGSL